MKAKRDGKKRKLPKELARAIGKEVDRLRGDEIQESFAFRCNTDGGNISRIKKGTQPPSIHTLYHIAQATKTYMHEILRAAEAGIPAPLRLDLTDLEQAIILRLRDKNPEALSLAHKYLAAAENRGNPTVLIDDHEQPSTKHFEEKHGGSNPARKNQKKKKSAGGKSASRPAE